MKEKIYTIPVNEAFDTDCECALCALAKRFEKESVDYALGAAMMEPDYRILSNEKGYCNRHYARLFQKPNKLSLTLTVDTHLDELLGKLRKITDAAEQNSAGKGGFFKKEKSDPVADALSPVLTSTKSCIICEKLDTTMERYISVVFWLWEKEEEFRKKVENSKGFCLPHFCELLEKGKKYLGRKKYDEFCIFLCKKQEEELRRIKEDVHNFTLKFDYRNHGSKWGTEIDAPIRSIEKLSGYINED